jgi:hypothetical protein
MGYDVTFICNILLIRFRETYYMYVRGSRRKYMLGYIDCITPGNTELSNICGQTVRGDVAVYC